MGSILGCLRIREQPSSINTLAHSEWASSSLLSLLSLSLPSLPSFVAPRGKATRCSYNARRVAYRKGSCFETALSTGFPNLAAILKRIPRKYETAPLMPLSDYKKYLYTREGIIWLIYS